MEKEKLNQKIFYKPIAEWLKSKGFQSLITGGMSKNIVVPIHDLIPSKIFIVPDVIGVKDNKVAIVEVETKPEKIFETLGKCIVWKIISSLVFMAFPIENINIEFNFLKRFGIGQLGISSKEVKEIVEIIPKNSLEWHKVLELHPLDSKKEFKLASYVKNIIKNSFNN